VLNIAVLVSGGGTNLQALIQSSEAGAIPNGRIALVISSRPDAYALKRAHTHGIQTAVLPAKDFSSSEQFDSALLQLLQEHRIELVVLAGYLNILGKTVLDAYPNKIVNVHPSLIPSFCGPGFYGLRVHEAAVKKGVKITGATVHFVTEDVDAGPIILQKAVEVAASDTPEKLQRKVMEQAEWQLLPQAVSLICDGRVQVLNGIVHILPEKGSLPGENNEKREEFI
jgi:phosphoribosylglycinamide formyltransferase-1